MTSCLGRSRLSIFCSSVRIFGVDDDDVAGIDWLELEFDVVDVRLEDDDKDVLLLLEVEDWLWRWAFLASSSRFSSSRIFWSRFCSRSERLKTLFPPPSSARAWRFLRSSCFRRSI